MERPNSDQRIRRVIWGLGVFYLVVLLGTVSTTALKFRDYYTAPVLDRAQGEDAVLQSWELNYEQRYTAYRQFVKVIGLILALYLPIWAAALGVWEKSIWKGLIALAVGGVATVLALSALPLVYFPFDQYPVSALWVIGGLPWIALTWAVVTICGRILRQRISQIPTPAH
jgi:hypothetical protein